MIALVQHLDGVDFIGACTTLAGEPPPKNDQPVRKIVAEEYRYDREDGELAFVVKRVEFQGPDGTYQLTKDGKRKKSFRQCRPDPKKPGGWIWNVEGVPPLLYRLPEVIEAVANERPIVIVEGERKVDRLWSLNVPATCNAGGAKKWKPEHAEPLAGANVIVLPDNDTPGRDHVDVVAGSLADIAASIRVLNLPSLKPKGDIVDWIKGGGTVEELHRLIEQEAKFWTPSEPDPDPPRSPPIRTMRLRLNSPPGTALTPATSRIVGSGYSGRRRFGSSMRRSALLITRVASAGTSPRTVTPHGSPLPWPVRRRWPPLSDWPRPTAASLRPPTSGISMPRSSTEKP